MTAKRALPVLAFLSLAVLSAAVPAAAQDMALDNGKIRAAFNDRGLVSLGAPQTGRKLTFSADPSSVTIDGEAVDIGGLGPAEIETTPAKIAYRYMRDPYTFDVIYELKPAWNFLTKQIVVTSARSRVFRVQEVKIMASSLGLPVAEELKLAGGSFGALCRFAAAGGPPTVPRVPSDRRITRFPTRG